MYSGYRASSCAHKEETIGHLLVHCQQAHMLWDIILVIVGMGWVFPFPICQALLYWQGARVGKKCKKVWRGAPPLPLLDSLARKE